jgi:formylglycine-generating enzyme required for sulfatase activity
LKTIIFFTRPYVLALGVLASFATPTWADEVSIPDPGLNAAIREELNKPIGPLTDQDLLSLTNLSAGERNIQRTDGLDAARNLRFLDLDSNALTNFSLPSGLTQLELLDVSFNALTQCAIPGELTNLDTLFLPGNALANFTLPAGLTGLNELHLWINRLSSLTVPGDMTNLTILSLFSNQLTNLALPANLKRLDDLDLDSNQLSGLTFPAGLTSLRFLVLPNNQLTGLSFPADMTNLNFVDIGENQLSKLTMPVPLPHLNFLRVSSNKLTSLALPSGMTNLSAIFLQSNQLTNLSLSSGMTNLSQLDLRGNQLTSLTLPPDMTRLGTLLLEGNPLTTLVLSETMAAGRLVATVASLKDQGVSVFTYPLSIQLNRPRQLTGAFQFEIAGPPGVYTVLQSVNLATWSELGATTNSVGGISFTDTTAHLSSRRFYRALLQSSPANMVFIAPNTFTMGSPTNEQDRSINEGPQTTVTLTRGFWIGQYEVTQGEYLSIMNTNPSPFPGDLSRPVSSVSWLDATNYCAKLTQRELAAGRIPAGSQYRLPTEAEWECAARAGTSTRFSYGDDPGYTILKDHAWYVLNSSLTAHPVGQKLPNPWGLYDMEGNVVEWCQDWFGSLPGGVQTDPTGPASSTSGRKVVRGGAFDNFESSSRSASRLLFNAVLPPLTDTDLGFRVVFVTGQL